jgi:methionyl-tRNA synthetase
MSNRIYITTSIPYVNGDPHVGFALECVQADVLARHYRSRGADVRFLSGTDDNSLKNVEAAAAAGTPVADYVRAKAARFAALRAPLQLSYDDFISTSVDPRHRAGVERLWHACAAAGDLYERDYEGLYCAGCEGFLAPDELRDGRCPEHDEPPQLVAERNWFFRLSRYQERLASLIETGRVRIEPEHRRNEALAFVRGGLDDFSVSRSSERARGWGIPVPDDPAQVIYVWFDALGNYLTALEYGWDGEAFRRWWAESDERIHVIGKGILRFHAVYWPAILLSAGEQLPTAIFVHDYLTVNGEKIAKSRGNAVEPTAVAAEYGADALRWWYARSVPSAGDTDFRHALVAARGDELANELGNLVNRTIALAGERALSPSGDEHELAGSTREAVARVDEALSRFDVRSAADAVWALATAANRFVSNARPWELAEPERGRVVGALLETCRAIAREVAPFLPEAAARIELALDTLDRELGRTLFRKAA